MYGITSLLRYVHTVATRYHLNYPLVMKPRIQNSVLPRDIILEAKFKMLPLSMFDYIPISVHRNNFKPCNWYISPHVKYKKEKFKGGFWPFVPKKKEIWNMPRLGWYHLRHASGFQDPYTIVTLSKI